MTTTTGLAHRAPQEHEWVGRRLRALRQRAGLGGNEAARRAGLSQSKVSRMENNRFRPAVEDVQALCSVYDATPQETAELVSLAEEVRGASKRARLVFPHNASGLQTMYGRMEATAQVVRSYNPTVVTGTLQTRAYIRLIWGEEHTGDGLEEVVEARIARRAALGDQSGQYVFILTEGALRWQAGGPEVMVEQIDTLIEASHVPNVRLGIIPWTTSVDVFCSHGFHLYDQAAVVVGTEVDAVTFVDHEDVEIYDKLFGRLEALASFDDDARRELVRIADEYRSLARGKS